MMSMNDYYSDVIHFKGNHYDFGYMQGELLKDSPTLYNRKKQRASRSKHHFTTNAQEAIDLFSKFMPHMLEELNGLAKSLQWTMEEAVRELDRKSTRLNSSHVAISYAVFC